MSPESGTRSASPLLPLARPDRGVHHGTTVRGALAVSVVTITGLCSGAGAAQLQQQIEYVRSGGSVWIANADGSGQHRSTLPGYLWWSPDGKRALFERRLGQRELLYVADGAGRRPRKVFRLYLDDDCLDPDWSPTGAILAFIIGCDIDYKDLYVVRGDGTHRKHLLPHTFWTLGPRWSPDGRELLFGGSPPRAHGRYWLYVTNAAGQTPVRISEITFSFYYDIGWAWSPDGESIYLVADLSDTNRGFELMKVDRRTGTMERLTPPDMNVRNLDVSQSGRVVFQGSIGTRDWEIYAIAADGRELQQLTDNRGFEDSGPQWSADGQRILFTSNRDGNDEIYVMNADGTDQRNISNSTTDDHSPTWIP
jgi:Tol biopolymer transport system component